MGMFDTFMGDLICRKCDAVMRIEEQTKDFDCCLEEFYVGDYVDRANVNKYFESDQPVECPNCHEKHKLSFAIKNGQFVGIYYQDQVKSQSINDLDNVPEHYERKRMYEKMCQAKIGVDPPKRVKMLHRRHVGDFITVLCTKWTIKEVYREVLIEEKGERKKHPARIFYENNNIYRVTDGADDRIVVERLNMFSGEKRLSVKIDSFEQKDNRSREDKDRYKIQYGCRLVRIE